MSYFKTNLRTERTSALIMALAEHIGIDEMLTEEALALIDGPADQAHAVYVVVLKELADEIDRRIPIPETN